MNVVSVMEVFPSEQDCIAHLEGLRWRDKPRCPHRGARHVARKTVKSIIGRWNCHAKHCKSTFTVKTGTMFNGTKVALRKWFVAISLMMNANKSVSSHQLGRDLGITQQTALAMQHKIRREMGRKASNWILKGVIEADETFMGGEGESYGQDDINPDGTNVVGWRGLGQGNIYGALIKWFYSGTKNIKENDLVLNYYKQCKKHSQPLTGSYHCMRNMLSHEFGHFAGLRDVYLKQCSEYDRYTMYGGTLQNHDKETLECEDKFALHHKYGYQ